MIPQILSKNPSDELKDVTLFWVINVSIFRAVVPSFTHEIEQCDTNQMLLFKIADTVLMILLRHVTTFTKFANAKQP